MLTAEDRARLRCEAATLPLVEPRWIAHAFSFPSNAEGARAVGAELERRGFAKVWVGEEVSGDDYWHVCGWRRQPLTHRTVANSRHQMEQLAANHRGVYDGWRSARGSLARQIEHGVEEP